jgi:hypothetical protein
VIALFFGGIFTDALSGGFLLGFGLGTLALLVDSAT